MAEKENKVYKVVDMYLDMKGEYDCLCDVPDEKRIYDIEGLPKGSEPNSMLMECPTKESYDSIIAWFENQPNILYATGTPIK